MPLDTNEKIASLNLKDRDPKTSMHLYILNNRQINCHSREARSNVTKERPKVPTLVVIKENLEDIIGSK